MTLKTAGTVFLTLNLIGSSAFSMTFEEYMARVRSKNKIFQSYDAAMEASQNKLTAGDISLSPVVTGEVSKAVDESQPATTMGPKREVMEYSLGVAKKFATGTSVSFSAQTNQFNNETAPPLDEFSTGGLGVSLSQSLWKDSFGYGTRLRQERERVVNKAEMLGIDLRRRGTLLEAESAFWDFAFAQDDLKLKKANLERAKKMEQWTSNRVSNGISDRADLMNVRALAALREVQLLTSEDEMKTQEIKLREFLVLDPSEPTPEVNDDMLTEKNYVNELSKKSNVVKIDAYLSSLQAQAKKLVAEEVEDSLRPDLALVGSYNTSAYDRSYSEVTRNMTRTDYPKTYVGLTLTWMLPTTAKAAQGRAASTDALASELEAERNLILGRNAWADLLRKYETTKKSVTTLQKVASFQRERAKAEQDKLNKGRTVTANVVTAETEAAEAELSLLRAKSGLRKLEASSILYIAE